MTKNSVQFFLSEARITATPGASKMRLAIFLFLLGFLSSLLAAAQVAQPARYERPHKSSDREFIVISMNELGIALVRDTEKFEDGKKKWEVIFVDSALHEKQILTFYLEDRLNLIGHDYRDEHLYVLYREGETDGGKLSLLKVNPLTYAYEQFSIKPELNINLTHFSIIEDKAILAGYVSREPAVLLYNMPLNQTKVIPGFFLSDTELVDVRVNKNNTFNTLLTGRSKSKKLILKTFDASGALLLDDVIEVDHDKTILTGITSTLLRDELMIIGLWADGSNHLATGIYTVLADPFIDQKINYYDFVQMDHYIDYLGTKRAAKQRYRAERRRMQGKLPYFKTALLPVRLEENNDGFIFLSEAYYAPYSITNSQRYNNYNNPYNPTNPFYGYSPYGYPYTSRYNYPYSYGPFGTTNYNNYDTKMNQASVAFFDSKGKLISDVSCPLLETRLPSKEQVSDFIFKPGHVTIAFKKDKQFYVQSSDEDGGNIIAEKIKPDLSNPDEVIKSETEDIGNVRFWYGNNLYAWGNQTLKKSGEPSRDIFYITKLKVN